MPENIIPKRPDKKQITPDGYILWPQGKEENTQTGIQEETLVETPNEPKTIISNQSSEQLVPEESIKKISSKQRELQKTNTKIKG